MDIQTAREQEIAQARTKFQTAQNNLLAKVFVYYHDLPQSVRIAVDEAKGAEYALHKVLFKGE